MKLLKSSACFSLALTLLPTGSFAQVRDYREIKTPPLRKVVAPRPERVQLDNGMVIFLMEDHELPLIGATARIRGGGRDVAADKAGLVGILSQAWRTGGTESRTGDQLDELLESKAAVVETGGREDSTSVTMNVLKNDFDTVFPIFLDLLKAPALRQDKIDLAKTQANAGISRRNDDAAGIMTREATKLGYGAGSPYARQAEYSSISSITREDLLAFHKRFVHPNNMVFGVVGDFDTAQMKAKLRQAFASWPRGPQAPPPATAITPAKPGVYYVAKDDVNQSNIMLVHSGTTRSSPDYAALTVLNDILNTDRLFAHIRTQQGLAYGVGGGVGTDWDHPGLFRVQVGTKSGTTRQAIDAVRAELDALQTQPFTAEEMTRAREAIVNAHVFTMDSRSKVLNQQVNLEFYGYPADFDDRYIAMVDKVTAADVSRVAKKYVTPGQVALLVVGNEKDFDKPLSTLGTVSPVDITIPEAGGSAKSAAPVAGNAEGAALAMKVTEFIGGKARIDAVKSVRTIGSASRKTPQGPMEIEFDNLTVYPDRQRSVIKMPMGEMTMVMSGDSAFAVIPGMGVRDLPSSQRDAMKAESRQEMLTVLKSSGQYTFAVSGKERIGAVDAAVLEVSAGSDSMKWLVDPASGKVLRKVSRGRGPAAQGDQVTDYTEWKAFGGLMFPVSTTMTSNGEASGSGTVKNVEVNAAVDPAMFVKPAAP